jgi:uncharacterized protein (TIGR03437 family)
MTFTIGANPIIQSVTSASTFIQVSAPPQTVAPYDLISIFGTNFCTSQGSGCSSNTVLYSPPDPVTLRYGTSVTPDTSSSSPFYATPRQLTVTFTSTGPSPTTVSAPILFASNSQINILVPSTLTPGSNYNMNVNFGPTAAVKSSAPYQVSVVASDPGIFTIGQDGRGDGAILAGGTYSLISQSNPAGMRTTTGTSDTVQIFMTGLGVPASSAANTSAGGGAYPTDCISIANYDSALTNQTGVAVNTPDGAIIQSALINSTRKAPCMSTNPTATVGGVVATVTYAGWVEDSVAGLYQVNVKLPARAAGTFHPMTGSTFTNLVQPAYLPIVITSASNSSQTNVALWVTPKLTVTAPAASGLSGDVGNPWPTSTVVASDGAVGGYTYAVTSGTLPAGLALNPSTGAITGEPVAYTNSAAGYVVSVTASDTSTVPVTGTVTFTLNIGNGVFLTAPGAPFNPGATGTAYPAAATILPTTGVGPYTYTISSSPANAGITLDSTTTNAVDIASTVGTGTYQVTVTATDSSTPALSGSITFPITIN